MVFVREHASPLFLGMHATAHHPPSLLKGTNTQVSS